MCDVIEEIKRLQAVERRLENTLDKLEQLGQWIEDWDSKDPDRLPLSHEGKIGMVRSVYNFCKR